MNHAMHSTTTSEVPKSVGSLQLPHGSAYLTARPTDCFDDEAWVELGGIYTSATSEAFWYVMSCFTHESHWNRTIFDMTLTGDEFVPSNSSLQTEGASSPSRSPQREKFPSKEWRYNAIRTLSRKTPAPIGGGKDGTQPTYTANEWTAQFIDSRATNDIHNAVFGLVIPESVITPDNPRAMRYWPFQYPKVRCYRFSYGVGKEGGTLRYSVVPLGDEACNPRHFETLQRHSKRTAQKLLSTVRKRAESYDPVLKCSTYVKRVVHDNLLTEHEYRKRYDLLKVKYSFWVEKWTECTDPVKFVYEEMGIAAYLCALWEKERREEGLTEKQTFLDCGCGNGFLVYLLIMEGHEGIGIDLQKRNIWDQYPEKVRASLRHEELDPQTFDCSKWDWILGNHSDELSPWIPVMAARCQRKKPDRMMVNLDERTLPDDGPKKAVRRAGPKIFILPCCFYDFDGKKVVFGNTRRTLGVRAASGTGKYEQYYRWIAQIAKAFGFTVEYENLRIPSTKYVSILGRFIEFEDRTDIARVKEMTALLTLDARLSHS